jgi:hypothetical protein
MKTSSSTSPSRTHRLAILLAASTLVLVPLAACSDEGGNSEQNCFQEDPPPTPGHPSDSTFRGRITVEHDVNFAAGGTPEGSIVAAFSDLTYAEMKSRQPVTLSDYSCAGLTGAPYKVCHQDPPCTVESLDADKIDVEGLAGGTVALERTAVGRFSKQKLAGDLFGGTVKVVVTGQSKTGFMPSYDQSLEPPDLLSLSKPDLSSTTAVGESDLQLSWSAGNGDFIVLEIKTTDPNVTDKVQCILKDDGCHHLHAGVFDWLEVKTGDTFKLTMARVRRVHKSLDNKTSVELNLTSQIEGELTR